jgi:rRNA maturation RNase YbeY
MDFLNRDYFTDIITFDNSNGNLISGEMYISLERVKDNAEIYKVELLSELYRVIFHGILHMMGYKDKDEKEEAVMREKENAYLNEYFVKK